MSDKEILQFEEAALAREMIAASDPLGGGCERLPDMDAGFSRIDRPRHMNSADDIRRGRRRFGEGGRSAPLERLDVSRVEASLSRPYRRSKRSKVPFKRSFFTSFRDHRPVRFIRYDIDAHFPIDGQPLWPDDDRERLEAVIAERDRNKRLLMERFETLGIEAMWTESPGQNLDFFREGDVDEFDGVRVTGYYAFVRIEPRTPAELRGLCAAFQTASGIEVSWATPNRLIRIPGQPGTPAIDPETCERIDTDGAYGEDYPHRRRMAGAALIYEDLRPVAGAMLEALLSCEGLPDDCRVGTEEPEFDILALWGKFMEEEGDRAPAPSERRASHPDGEGDAASRPVPERNAERSGSFSLRETPE